MTNCGWLAFVMGKDPIHGGFHAGAAVAFHAGLFCLSVAVVMLAWTVAKRKKAKKVGFPPSFWLFLLSGAGLVVVSAVVSSVN